MLLVASRSYSFGYAGIRADPDAQDGWLGKLGPARPVHSDQPPCLSCLIRQQSHRLENALLRISATFETQPCLLPHRLNLFPSFKPYGR